MRAFCDWFISILNAFDAPHFRNIQSLEQLKKKDYANRLVANLWGRVKKDLEGEGVGL